MNLRSNDHSTVQFPLLIALYGLEITILLLALTVPRLGGHITMLSLVKNRSAIVALLAFSLLAGSIFVMVAHLRRPAAEWIEFKLAVALNLLTVLLVLTIGELIVRLFSVQTSSGVEFMKVSLMPRSWETTAKGHLKRWREASAKGSYLVYDELLGWTIGASRGSRDGQYYSSVEGIRSHGPNVSFSNAPVSYRIALVGDSFTFGVKARYEDTWGHGLERILGAGVQVLNFGIDGYGVDQMYLKYIQDVRPWQPNLVILGLINHDFYRSVAVYNFASMGWALPFAKPRFIERENQLRLLNVPLPTPEEIFTALSISELPFIDYDAGIHQDDWQWHYYHYSALIRYLISLWPAASRTTEQSSESAIVDLNSTLLRCFAWSAWTQGSALLVVYFPSRRDFLNDTASFGGENNIARRVFDLAGVPFVDLTSCVIGVHSRERFVPDDPHYSPATNAAIARCLADLLNKDTRSQNTMRARLRVPLTGAEIKPSVRAGLGGQVSDGYLAMQ
jgi:hypothetical protein